MLLGPAGESIPVRDGELCLGQWQRVLFLELDREFHLRSYTGCHIDQLTSSVTRLWNSTAHYRRTFVTLTGPGRRWVINAEHRLLLDAVARKDVVDAERFIAGHIRRTRIELSRHPEIFGEGSR